LELAKRTIDEGLSVRKLEEAAKETPVVPVPPRKAAPKTMSPELTAFQDAMREAFGVKTVVNGNDKKGKITISYNSAQELEMLFEAVGKLLT